MKRFLVVLLVLVAIGSLMGNVLLYRRYSTNRPVVSLAGSAITVKDYRDRLEYLYGKPTLTKMVLTHVVMRAAAQAGVTPTKDDIERKIAFIRRRNPNQLEKALNDPQQMAELNQNLMTDMALENVTIKDVKVTESELAAFFAKARSLFSVPDQMAMTMVTAGNKVDTDTAVSLLKQKVPATTIVRQPRLGVVGLSVELDPSRLPKNFNQQIAAQLKATPEGGVFVLPIKMDKATALIVRVDRRSAAGVPPLEQVRPDVERYARLAKAAQQGKTTQKVLLDLYRQSSPRFETERYHSFLKDVGASAAAAADTKGAAGS